MSDDRIEQFAPERLPPDERTVVLTREQVCDMLAAENPEMTNDQMNALIDQFMWNKARVAWPARRRGPPCVRVGAEPIFPPARWTRLVGMVPQGD